MTVAVTEFLPADISAQDLADRVLWAMVEQGRPAYSESETGCRYRVGGLCCPFGALIPDSWPWLGEVEDYLAIGLLMGSAPDEPLPAVAQNDLARYWPHRRLIADFQGVHDALLTINFSAVRDSGEWRRDFLSLARRLYRHHGLQWRVDENEAQAWIEGKWLVGELDAAAN